jgi:hypothetical protein
MAGVCPRITTYPPVGSVTVLEPGQSQVCSSNPPLPCARQQQRVNIEFDGVPFLLTYLRRSHSQPSSNGKETAPTPSSSNSSTPTPPNPKVPTPPPGRKHLSLAQKTRLPGSTALSRHVASPPSRLRSARRSSLWSRGRMARCTRNSRFSISITPGRRISS